MEKGYSHGGEVLRFSGKGEVYSFTIVRQAPSNFEFLGPYVVALVKLDEGNTVTAMLTDVHIDEVYIGMRVEMVTRKLSEDGDKGLITYGYKFRPTSSKLGKS